MEKGISVAALALAGTLAAGTVLAGGPREVRKTLPLDADGTLSVETYKGSVTVTAATGAEASVEARIVPDGDDAASLRRAEETDVVIEGVVGSHRDGPSPSLDHDVRLLGAP